MAVLFYLAIAAAIVCLYYLFGLYVTHKRFRDIIDKIPGPKANWISGNLLQFKLRRIDFTDQGVWLAYKYGYDGLYRLWRGQVPVVLFTRAHTAEAVLSSNKLIEKSRGYEFLKNWIGSGLLISGGEKWRSRRKMLTQTFHFAILNSFINVYHKQSLTFVDQVKSKAQSGISFNLYPYISRCALDIICETAMGVSINAQLNHKSDYVQAIKVNQLSSTKGTKTILFSEAIYEEIMQDLRQRQSAISDSDYHKKMCEIVMKYERMPWLWIKPIFRISMGQTYDKTLAVLRSFVENVIRDRIEERKNQTSTSIVHREKSHSAFLDLLLNMQNEHQLTPVDIREEVDTFMFEGHDTTSSGMAWTLFLLGHHKDIQDKVFEEIQSIYGTEQRVPTEQDIRDMKYLECVIKESLRLYPPVPMFGRTTTEDFESGGYFIPKKANLLIMPTFIHRDKEVWGEDVYIFNPDRFKPEASTGRHPYGYVPFSAGSRNCIGQKFALMEEKMVLSTFLRAYEVHSFMPIEQTLAIPELVSRLSGGLTVRLTARN